MVTAGNLGNDTRYEYTVIGDTVNEAARLSDLAKSLPSGIADTPYHVPSETR